VERLGLAEHAHKAAKHKAQARKSFHVHMPGEPRKPDRDAVSSGDEDEDEDEDDDDDEDGLLRSDAGDADADLSEPWVRLGLRSGPSARGSQAGAQGGFER
jgi:hypothetical protein